MIEPVYFLQIGFFQGILRWLLGVNEDETQNSFSYLRAAIGAVRTSLATLTANP